MKKRKLPTSFTILFILIALTAISTYFIPAGRYELDENDSPVPGTYRTVQSNPQDIGDVLISPFEGLYDAIDVAAFILMVGGFLGIVMKTGSIDMGINRITRRFKGKESVMIILLTVLFAIGGTTFGMAEETMAFYPLLIPILLSAGYDTVTAVAVILFGSGVGVLTSTVNPFATGIASGFAGIALGEGILLRLVMFVSLTAFAVFYILRYANKVKKDPSASIVSHQREENLSHFLSESEGENYALTKKDKLVLALFALTFLVMIYSVIPFSDLGITFIPTLAWWFPELSALFLIMGIIIGLVAKMPEKDIADNFIFGASDLIGVALIIGLSRAITVIMNNAMITDTILNYGENLLSNVGESIFAAICYVFYLPLSLLIPSTSALATLSMPIIAPLGDFAGVARDIIITAFQSACGLVNLITPTSGVVMGALTIGRISYGKWLKFMALPVIVLFIASVGAIMIGAVI